MLNMSPLRLVMASALLFWVGQILLNDAYTEGVANVCSDTDQAYARRDICDPPEIVPSFCIARLKANLAPEERATDLEKSALVTL